MEEVINKLSGHKFFAKIDLSKGYWQVEMTDVSRPLKLQRDYSGLKLCRPGL